MMMRCGFAIANLSVACLLPALAICSLGVSFSARATTPIERAVGIQQENVPAKKQIIGTWRLVSIYQEDDGGVEIDQFGGPPAGLFMADAEGNFSYQIMSNHKRRLLIGLPPAVVMSRNDGLIEAVNYFGSYVVDETAQTLTLHIAHCLFRGCDRTDRAAELKFHENMLQMTSVLESSPTGAFYTHTVWKRECCRQ
jgi:hypothetical protein